MTARPVGRRWTKDVLLAVCERRLAGETIKAIAPEYGVTAQTLGEVIWMRRREYGLPSFVRGRRNLWWTPERVLEAARRQADGEPRIAIAADMGCTLRSLRSALERNRIELGIPRQKPGRRLGTPIVRQVVNAPPALPARPRVSDEMILALAKHGYGVSAIATIMRAPYKHVRKVLGR